jgi:hypothetical protein
MQPPQPRIRCRCGYPLDDGRDCPECGGSYWDAVRLSAKQQRPRPIRLMILTAIVLSGAISPAIVALLFGPSTPAEADLGGYEVVMMGMVLWCATDLLAFCGVIASILHIGRTRWEPLVWVMLAIHALVIVGPLALVVVMLAAPA